MRRTALIWLALAALAAPAAAIAGRDAAAADGVLVVKSGQAPYVPGAPAKSTPVVQLIITGSVIGQVTDGGRVVIDAGPNPKGAPPEVTIPGPGSDVKGSDTARAWSSSDPFKFRAVGGKFTVLVYGSGVNLVAIGTGTVTLAGMPDTPRGDGWFAINGNDRQSLPGTPTKQLVIGDNS